jgi:hypothetical protein
MPDIDEPTTPLTPVPGPGSTPAGPAATPAGPAATTSDPASPARESQTTTATRTGPDPATPGIPARPGPRMRTLVLGLILLVAAASVLVGELTSIKVDGGVVFLGLMVVAGLLLIAGSATRRNP